MSLRDLNLITENKIIDEENIIIGSGAGGSTISYELLKNKKKSIILEEGPNIPNFKNTNIGKSIVSLYKNNGATPIYSLNGGPLIGYGQGSCVGGSTYVNAGYFSGTSEIIFKKWLSEQKTVMSFNEFQKLYNEIRSELKVNTENLTLKDEDSKFIYERSKTLNWKVDKCERFSSGFLGDKKHSMNFTYHKELMRNNIDIIYNCKVDKIITNGGFATSLISYDRVRKKKKLFKFKNLFINCGPISSPHLLLKNNLIKPDKKSKNFQFHINFKILVKFKKEINFNTNHKFDPDKPVSIYFMREFENEGVLLSAANSELPYMLATSSHFNDKIKKDIYLNPTHYAMYVYQIKSNSRGNVQNLFNNPLVSYNYNLSDNEQIKKAIERISNFFLCRETDFILFPIENSLPVKNNKDKINLLENFDHKKLHLVSVHGMSSLSVSNQKDSLTDYFGKLKGFKNIFINDASILPGNTGESPQASIMAFAKFIGKNLNLN